MFFYAYQLRTQKRFTALLSSSSPGVPSQTLFRQESLLTKFVCLVDLVEPNRVTNNKEKLSHQL